VWGYREEEPMGGRDPYSASKGCAEIVTAAYRKSFFANGAAVASARAGNVIGGGDWAEDRLVPDIIRGIARGVPVVIRNPMSTRPWQHVLDPLAGYLLLAKRLYEAPDAHAEGWNFGPKDETAVPAGELARRMVAVLGTGTLELIAPDPKAVHEASFLKLDCSKAHALLGWRPRLGIDDALDLTGRFYRAILRDPSSARAMLDQQIADFESRSA
jgi:CDP-glucose 4,6-dehydratase